MKHALATCVDERYIRDIIKQVSSLMHEDPFPVYPLLQEQV